MTSREDYNEQQWQLLVEAPRCAAMGVVVIDFGLVDFAQEAAVMVRFAQQAQAMYAHNTLIQGKCPVLYIILVNRLGRLEMDALLVFFSFYQPE